MILNQLIPVHEAPEDIKQYPLFQLYLYVDAIINIKRKKVPYKGPPAITRRALEMAEKYCPCPHWFSIIFYDEK